MKKAVLLLSAVLLFNSNVFAAINESEILEESEYNTIAPLYIAISTSSNSLSISNSGKAQCYGSTKASGYKAKVKVELQQKNGTWGTIKTWTKSGEISSAVSESYSVSKGYSYRLKTTHYALDSNGKVIESFTTYSSTKTYWFNQDAILTL